METTKRLPNRAEVLFTLISFGLVMFTYIVLYLNFLYILPY